MENYQQVDAYTNYRNKTLSSGDWALYIFLSTIPIIGLILLLVWALGDGNIHRRNWARGMFLIWIVAIGLIFFSVMFFGLGAAFLGDN